MALYGELCGWTLARAHARSGDRVAIAAYLGRGAAFDRALATFAEAYADQNERDYEALKTAVGSVGCWRPPGSADHVLYDSRTGTTRRIRHAGPSIMVYGDARRERAAITSGPRRMRVTVAW